MPERHQAVHVGDSGRRRAQGKFNGTGLAPEVLRGAQIAFDGMGAGDGHDVGVGEPGTFAGIGEAEYLPDQPVIPGSGGRERFRFRAVRTGRTTASFEYRRPWETSSAAAQTATYDVVVE